mgnify:CR=1 FL=1|tara:strand:+ start:421 stop:1050 length:630 start_codon:yes stop_codon:yes gene_type:complete
MFSFSDFLSAFSAPKPKQDRPKQPEALDSFSTSNWKKDPYTAARELADVTEQKSIVGMGPSRDTGWSYQRDSAGNVLKETEGGNKGKPKVQADMSWATYKSEKEQRRDDRQAENKGRKSVVTEVAEPEETTTAAAPATPVETAQQTMVQLADTTVSAEAAGRKRSEAEKNAQKDKNRGAKGGTIKTSPRGLLSTNIEGLRPSRSLIGAA